VEAKDFAELQLKEAPPMETQLREMQKDKSIEEMITAMLGYKEQEREEFVQLGLQILKEKIQYQTVVTHAKGYVRGFEVAQKELPEGFVDKLPVYEEASKDQ
jgi:hypothetical protein